VNISAAAPTPDPQQTPSDGYLDDAEQYEPDHPVPLPVLALMRLDRVIGNEFSLSQHGLGRVRGLVLDSLRTWHEEQQARRKGDA